MKHDDELNELMTAILAQLQECKRLIDTQFDEHGYDAAYFDLDIVLSVKIDTLKVEVTEKWDRMES